MGVGTGDLKRASEGVGAWIAGVVAATPAPTTQTFTIANWTVAQNLAGASVVLRLGSAGGGDVLASIQSNVGSAITLAAALAAAPAAGTPVYVFAQAVINAEVTAAENLKEISGTALTAADWTLLLQAIPSPNTGTTDPTAVDVANVATRIDTGLANRRYITMVNSGNQTVYLGFGANGNAVTTGTGLPLGPGASATFNIGASIKVYGIVAAGTASVPYLEVA